MGFDLPANRRLSSPPPTPRPLQMQQPPFDSQLTASRQNRRVTRRMLRRTCALKCGLGIGRLLLQLQQQKLLLLQLPNLASNADVVRPNGSCRRVGLNSSEVSESLEARQKIITHV